MDENENISLDNKNILITGGTTGIGRATALLLAKQGAKVFIFGRNKDHLNDALNDLHQFSKDAFGISADQVKLTDVEKVFTEFDKKFGKLDILINNAAIGNGDILKSNKEKASYMILDNLMGYIACTYEALNRMLKQKYGQIINVGSLSAESKDPGSEIYVATKSAIRGFTASLRKEVNKQGIRVSLVEPGLVGTDLNPISPKMQRQMQKEKTMLKAEDIAQTIVYILTRPSRMDIIKLQVRPHKQLI